MSSENPHNFTILLVEDSEEDIYLTKRAFEKSKLVVDLQVVKNGEAALDYLHQRYKYAESQTPDLILLDLNLPRIDGRQVLKDIKSNEDLKSIPVVILTTSNASEDILRSYKLHANSYVRKPVTFESFAKIIQSIEDFWLTVVRLPRKE